MFLRIRGKGACPENSQAALLHLRGFRHVHCPPPVGAYQLIAGDTAGNDNSAIEQEQGRLLRPFAFSHFAIGIHAPSVVEGQQRLLSLRKQQQRQQQRSGGTTYPADEHERDGAPDTLLPMAWKEVWNAYDIDCDDVLLLPPAFNATDAQLASLTAAAAAAPGGDSGNGNAGSGEDALPAGFTPLSARRSNAKAIVCTHYCAGAAWGTDLFDTPTNSDSIHNGNSTIVVIDLTDLPTADCARRLYVSLAWALGFAAMQRENVLLRATGVVVRLPYTSIPQRVATATEAEAVSYVPVCTTYQHTLDEARDFLGEHIQLVIAGSRIAVATHTTTTATPTAADAAAAMSESAIGSGGGGGAPALIAFVGRSAADLSAAVAALVRRGNSDREAAAPPVEVLVLRTDEHRPAPATATVTTATTATADDGGQSDEQLGMAALATVAAAASVGLLVAPVRALIDGGEEPWDPYSQREMARVNFCPCCGCGGGGEEEGEGKGKSVDHGHGHGHSHGH